MEKENIHPIRSKADLIAQLNGEYADVPFRLFYGHTPRAPGVVDQSCLSQWSPHSFQKDGTVYQTAEHAMMADKARACGDPAGLAAILAAPSPDAAKREGRRVRGYSDAIWDPVKFDAVVENNVAKFSQNPELREFLIRTHPGILVEASPYDRIWGIGLRAAHANSRDPTKWPGQNLLGFALMEVRRRLMQS